MRKITTIILFFSIIVPFNSNLGAQNADIDLLVKINSNPNRALRAYSVAVSKSTAPIAAAVPATLGIAALITNDREMLLDAVYIGASEAVALASSYALKRVIARPRPFDSYPDLIEPYYLKESYSLPSNNSSLAFSTATSLTLTYPKWWVATPAYLWAGSVAYSRMNLGVHYPGDVLAGAALGAASAWLTLKVNEQIRANFPKSKKEVHLVTFLD